MNADAFCRSLTPRFRTVGGVRTHYVECGSGPPLVLIHGLSASFWNWWQNLEALARHFRVIAYDLKGCGLSDRPRDSYTAAACAAHLHALMDALDVEQAALVAHSMGTRIALELAAQQPERVRGLVLASPSCYPQTAGRAVQVLILPGIGELYTQLRFTGRTDRIVRRTLQFCMHPGREISETHIYWNARSGRRKRRLAHCYLRYGRHMRFHLPWALAERYGAIDVPALIIGGDSDPFVPRQHVEQLAAALPRARAEIWSNTGHLPHAEQPERFSAAAIQFLRSREVERGANVSAAYRLSAYL